MSFRNTLYKNRTEPLKYIWQLKDFGTPSNVKWRIAAHASPYIQFVFNWEVQTLRYKFLTSLSWIYSVQIKALLQVIFGIGQPNLIKDLLNTE